MDIADFNRRWLQEWTNKSVAGVASFYHPDVTYFDENVPAGLQGKAALEAYLPLVFAQVPDWVYFPDEVWSVENGFCGRWYMDLGTAPDIMKLRGFDFVLLKDDLIIFNEVYTHRFPPAA